jgi:hypothetical protein
MGETVAVSATTTDVDLDEMKWIANPGGSETEVASDATDPYSTTFVNALALGAHTLVARAVRGAQSTDSAPIDLTSVNLTRQLKTFMTSGTWTEPAVYWSPAGVRLQRRSRSWAGGAGGTLAVGAGGGGGFSEEAAGVGGGGNVAVTVATAAAANVDGGNSSFGTECIAIGGLSGLNGGLGGTAAAGTGSTKFSGGNGGVGAGNTIGGAGAGDAGSATTSTPGVSTGGFNSVGVAGRYLGAGGSSQAAAQFAGSRGEVRVDVDIPATVGYPRVRGRTWGRDAANATTRPASLTTLGTIVAGDRLVAAVISDGIPVIDITGWTKKAQENEGTSQVSGAWFELPAVGGETSATITTDASEQVAWVIWLIKDGGAIEVGDASGNSTNADPPSVVYSGGSIKGLALAVAGWDQHGAITAIPAGYDAQLTVPSQSAGAPQLCSCELFAETDTFNPGAFTSAAEQWVAATIIVPPA